MNNKKSLFAMENGLDKSKPISDTAPAKKIDSGGETGLSEAGKRVNLWSSMEERAKDFPQAYRGHYLWGVEGKSRRLAFRVNCLMYMGYSPSEVQKCTASACPPFPYRMRG